MGAGWDKSLRRRTRIDAGRKLGTSAYCDSPALE
jgi:hypothetical protein